MGHLSTPAHQIKNNPLIPFMFYVLVTGRTDEQMDGRMDGQRLTMIHPI